MKPLFNRVHWKWKGFVLHRYPGASPAAAGRRMESHVCSAAAKLCPSSPNTASEVFEMAGTVGLMISPLPSNPPCLKGYSPVLWFIRQPHRRLGWH